MYHRIITARYNPFRPWSRRVRGHLFIFIKFLRKQHHSSAHGIPDIIMRRRPILLPKVKNSKPTRKASGSSKRENHVHFQKQLVSGNTIVAARRVYEVLIDRSTTNIILYARSSLFLPRRVANEIFLFVKNSAKSKITEKPYKYSSSPVVLFFFPPSPFRWRCGT